MSIKAIIFDVYGTLLSTGTGSVDASREILRRCGHSEIDATVFYGNWKKLHKQHMNFCVENGFLPEREIFALDLEELYRMYGIVSDARRDVSVMLASLYNRKMYEDTSASLAYLGSHYRLIIGSNTDTEPMLQNFVYNGLQFSEIYTSESLQCYKPDIVFYQRLLDQAGLQPGEAVFVGDNPIDDVAGPKAAGIRAYHLDRKGVVKTSEGNKVLHTLPTTLVENW